MRDPRTPNRGRLAWAGPRQRSNVRVHLIDGTYELCRAHFSKRPPRTDPDGRDIKATVGLTESLLALLHDEAEAVTHVAVAFDNPIRSFRNDLFPGYKDDGSLPPEVVAQFDLAEDAARALGLRVWSMDEYEADDAIATGAARWAEQVDQVRLMSPDKDFGQCLRGQRVVQVDRRRQKVLDEEGLRRQRGFGPESIADFLALVGDDADGLPGLPGFGEKTAAALLARWRHLDAVPPEPVHWQVAVRGVERLAATLTARRDDALLYRRLATLVRDVPLAEELEDLSWGGVPRAAFSAWCGKLGIGWLAERPSRWR